jgi:hypothetical protein
MKYLLILPLLFWFLTTSVSALSSELRVYPTEVGLWERIQLELELQGETLNWDLETDIAWLENFRVFSRSQQMQFQSINWEIQSSLLIRLELEAHQAGSYTLGPSRITVGQDILEDRTQIEVRVWNTWSFWTSKQENSGITTRWENTPENTPENTWEQSQEWKTQYPELYGIIEEHTLLTLLKKYWAYLLIIALLTLILSLMLARILKAWEVKKDSIQAQDTTPELSLYEKYFHTLSRCDSSDVFLKKYLRSTENYLTDASNTQQNYTPLTLEEMKQYASFQNYMLRKDFETLYKRYYSREELSEAEISQYIDNLQTHLN